MIEQILEADRYLQVDQIGRARGVYQKVVDLDPGNAIAIVGLARCALAEGQDQKAYELASRALQLDPENDMARRMEARLSEILATRGEPVERPAAAATPNPQEMRPVVTETPDTSPATQAVDQPAERPAPSPTPARPTPPTPSPTPARPTPSPTPSPTKAKEPAVHKSLLDRLLGR